MKLLFIRHGESTANVLREFANSNNNHPLTERGVAQAQALATRLAGLEVEKVYTSPVLRAVQTATIVAESLPAPLEITEALREWNVGIYEGTTDPVGWELHRQVMADWMFHGKPESKMPGGENFLEIKARFVPFIDKLVQEGGDQTLVLVGHGGLYSTMLPLVLANIDYAFVLAQDWPYTLTITVETGPGGLRCTAWGDEVF
jgi:probable phosphoglycerate mutase